MSLVELLLNPAPVAWSRWRPAHGQSSHSPDALMMYYICSKLDIILSSHERHDPTLLPPSALAKEAINLYIGALDSCASNKMPKNSNGVILHATLIAVYMHP